MFQYSGNSASYPPFIGIMDDSDTPNFTHLAVGMEALADRSAYFNNRYIDGKSGGVYNPTNPVVLGDRGLAQPSGAQWNLEGTLYFDGTLTGPGVPTPIVLLDGTNATLELQSGAELHITSGGVLLDGGAGVLWSSGTVATLASGAEFDVSSGASIFVAGPNGIVVESPGGSILVQNNGTIELTKGQDLLIDDSTYPRWSASKSRSITQPLILLPGSSATGGGTAFDHLVDNGGVYFIPVTKIANGFTFYAVTVHNSWSSAHSPPGGTGATITVFKTDVTTGTRTTIGGPLLVDTSTGTSGFWVVTITASETVDDSTFIYTVEYSGETGVGAQAITWQAPIVTIHDITDIRGI